MMTGLKLVDEDFDLSGLDAEIIKSMAELAAEAEPKLDEGHSLEWWTDVHSKTIEEYTKRRNDARKAGKARREQLKEQRRQLKARYDAELEVIALQEAANAAKTKELIERADTMIEVSRSALKILERKV